MDIQINQVSHRVNAKDYQYRNPEGESQIDREQPLRPSNEEDSLISML